MATSKQHPPKPIRAIRMAVPDRKTVKTLGEYSYAIPDVSKRPSPFKQTLMLALALVLSPLLLTVLVIYTVFMFLGPMPLRNRVLSKVIPYAMKSLEGITHNQRKLLLQHVSGKVLDIGAGGGAYLQHCKRASHYVAIEPVEGMHPLLANKAKLAGLKDYQVTIRSGGFETYDAPVSSFDWIILGNVLCEVHDVHATLNKVHHLLKPGGHVYFSEHLGAPLHSVTRKFQEFMNPWWRQVSGGCNCNRDSLHAIEGMGSWDVVSWSLDGISVWGGPMVMGLARKVVSDL
jgi:SAM-dependent methyltransferase